MPSAVPIYLKWTSDRCAIWFHETDPPPDEMKVHIMTLFGSLLLQSPEKITDYSVEDYIRGVETRIFSGVSNGFPFVRDAKEMQARAKVVRRRKKKGKFTLPDELREFLRDSLELIESAEEDTYLEDDSMLCNWWRSRAGTSLPTRPTRKTTRGN